jgi:hypothetical protein
MPNLNLSPTYYALLFMIVSGLVFLWLGGKYEARWERRQEAKDVAQNAMDHGFVIIAETDEWISSSLRAGEVRVQMLIWNGMDRALADAIDGLRGQARRDALDLWAHVRSQRLQLAEDGKAVEADKPAPISNLREIAARKWAPFHRGDC